MPLGQLITAFSRAATTEASEVLQNDFLYISYANIMSQVQLLSQKGLMVHKQFLTVFGVKGN